MKQSNVKKPEKNKDFGKKIEELEMAVRMVNMLMQQLGMGMKNITDELDKINGTVRARNFDILALMDILGIDSKRLDEKSKELQIAAFQAGSDAEDAALNLIAAEVADENSVVIVTSAPEVEDGVLRSRVDLAAVPTLEIKSAFVGKKVGDLVVVEAGGVAHHLIVLGIRAHKPE